MGVTVPSREHTDVTPLNDCFVKLPSKRICTALTLDQRRLSWLWVVVNAELYKLVETLRINDREMQMRYQPPTIQGSENIKDDRLKGTKN